MKRSPRRFSLALAGLALCLANAKPGLAGDGLESSFAELSDALKAGTALIGASGVPADAPLAASQSETKGQYQEVANAFMGMGAMPDPAEMVAWGGVWNLELAASEAAVVYSSSGLAWKKGLKTGLKFSQELIRSEDPYSNGAAVFRVQERGIRVALFARLNGDPPAVVLDLQKPSEFSTTYEAGLGGRTVKAYSCRSNDERRILCKAEVRETLVVPVSTRTLYLGFKRAKP
ncbi:MAG: hypothetical protein HY924_10965 [Elusimicrobia bacterium]|nr:hypothetical protein [Elusimicrobiota bacterium]